MSSSTTRAADAYEKLVEKLLASPHHGERWARVLARRGPLRRQRRLREGQVAAGVGVPRLGHQGAQRRHAVRPVRDRADRRRPSAERDAGPDRRDRLPPHVDAQRGGRHRPRAVPHGRDVRPDGRGRQGVPRPLASRVPSATTTSSTRSRRRSISSSSRTSTTTTRPQRVVYTAAEQMKINRLREEMRDAEDGAEGDEPRLAEADGEVGSGIAEATGVEDGRGRERQRQLAAVHPAEGRLDSRAGLRTDQVQHADARPEPGEDDHRVPARTAQRRRICRATDPAGRSWARARSPSSSSRSSPRRSRASGRR